MDAPAIYEPKIMLPCALYRTLVETPAAVFSGTRHGYSYPAMLATISLVCRWLPPGCPIMVGDCRGVDAAVRNWRPDAQVFHTPGETPRERRQPRNLVARTLATLATAHESRATMLAFPAGECPRGLWPRRTWQGARGSGTWGSVAWYLGQGNKAYVYCRYAPPARNWHHTTWTALGRDWYHVAHD